MIYLKNIHAVSAKEIQKLANNSEIAKNLKDGFPYPYILQHATDFLRFVDEGLLGHVFAIFNENDFIGIGSIVPQQDIYKNNGEIGYWIGQPYWGKGYGKKTVELLTVFAFEELHLIRVFAGVFEHNTASMKVLEHAGYKLEAIMKSSIVKYGRIMDEHIYSILNPTGVGQLNATT